jgi:hypothetical protein
VGPGIQAAANRWCWLAAVLAVGCTDLPDDQLLTSAHFRYHARADTVLDPTIMNRLEADRAEFDARYAVDPGMIDYYLFRDDADRDANSPCPTGNNCTDQRSVMSSTPFHEHELVHAFLYDTGQPAPVVAEGFAQYAACIVPRLAYLVPPNQWPVAVGSASAGPVGDAKVYVYNFGQRLIAWMMAVGGTKTALDFYHRSLGTTDAALFALQFKRFWGRGLGDVAVELQDARYAGSSCPCTAPALSDDGSATSFVTLQEYRTVDVDVESRLELANDGGQLVFPFVCANAADDGPLLPIHDAPPGASLTIARVGSGRYGVTTAYPAIGTAVVRQSHQAADDWTCDTAAANPVALAGQEITAWVAPGMEGGTWFAFTLDGDATLDILGESTEVVLCPSCAEARSALSPCGLPLMSFDRPTAISVPRPSSGMIVIGLFTGDSNGTSLGVRLRPAP